MAIAQVYTWHPRPGRIADFMAIAKKVDKIIRWPGRYDPDAEPDFRRRRRARLYVIETANWKAFGELAAKLEADKAWQALMVEVNSTDKPTADLISSAVYSEIPLG